MLHWKPTTMAANVPVRFNGSKNPKIVFFREDLGTRYLHVITVITRFLGPIRAHVPIGILVDFHLFCRDGSQLRPTDTHTDTQTTLHV